MSKVEIKKIVKRYANKLKAENYPFSAVYVFGSQINGQARKNSDIDVAVVSSRLKRNWNRNEEELWRHTLSVDPRIEPVGFTPEEFKSHEDVLIDEIRNKGLRII